MEREPLIIPGFLIAEPELLDPNFEKTVIALVHHDKTGSFGLVLNRPSNIVLSDVLPGYDATPHENLPLYLGGPVDPNRLFTLHSGVTGFPTSKQAITLGPGLLFEPDFSVVQDLLHYEKPQHLRFYLGYAGWDEDQLNREYAERSWISSYASGSIAFEKPGPQLWQLALSAISPYYAVVAQTGFRPSLN